MKIVLLHFAAPPVVGGVESVMGRHARLMAEAGHQVCILAGRGAQTDPAIDFARVPEADSRDAAVLATKAELDAGRVPAGFDEMTEELVTRLRPVLSSAERLVAHNVCSLNKNLALTAALHRLTRDWQAGRLILWHHDIAWTSERYRAQLHTGYPWDLLRADWPWATQVVVSEQRRRELAGLLSVPEQRIHVVPNGIEVREFLKQEPQTRELVARLRLDQAAPLLLLPVRITPRKNIELAMRVLAALLESFPQARLVVTGPLGPHNPANRVYFERLRGLRTDLGSDDHVAFLAEVAERPMPDAVISDLYQLADALILPSRDEGFGIPLLEAGLAGIPVFCSDIPALREIGSTLVSYFSPDEEPAALAGRIGAALRASRTYALRKRVLGDYSWEHIYAAHIAPLLEGGEA